MLRLEFSDKSVSYSTFIEDLSTALAPKLKEMMSNPSDVISQRQAWLRYGKGNVNRWLQKGLLKPFSKRPGKIEYKIADLAACHNRLQDYLE